MCRAIFILISITYQSSTVYFNQSISNILYVGVRAVPAAVWQCVEQEGACCLSVMFRKDSSLSGK